MVFHLVISSNCRYTNSRLQNNNFVKLNIKDFTKSSFSRYSDRMGTVVMLGVRNRVERKV